MKNIIKSIIGLGCAAVMFTACESDRDSNPTIQQPTTFQLNTPADANNAVVLADAGTISLTCKQPDYGYTAPVTYYVQMSLSEEFTNAVFDEEGNEVTPANYLLLDESSTQTSIAISAKSVNRNIMKLSGITEASQVPAEMDVYMRMAATLDAGYGCLSNVVKIKVAPFFQPLVAADPVEWYLVGGNVGDGSWSMGAEYLGISLVPMTIQDASFYDELTGEGILLYTGYFTASQGFKFIMTPSDKTWTNQYGSGSDAIVVGDWFALDRNNGGSGNINVPADGYYKVELNTQANTMQLTALEEEPNCYPQMGVAGGFNGWSYQDMTPVNTVDGMKNHIWSFEIETDGTELKFLSDSSWAHNWGAAAFPYGTAAGGGANIPVPAGKWLVIFNDVDGFYYFFAQ